MDPIANIKRQHRIAEEIVSLWSACDQDGQLAIADSDLAAEYANDLAELVLALDEWRKSGGFDPYLAADYLEEKR